MNPNKLLLPLAALMLACTPLVGASGTNDGICDGDGGGGRDNEGANIQCEVIAGPALLTIKSVVSVGVGFCQTENTNIPIHCDGNPGDTNGAGAATFGDSAWTGDKEINVEVTNDAATCTSVTSPPCGFTVDICNDRDQDSTCTNISAQNDELPETQSGDGVLGVCKDSDSKENCTDPNKAAWQGCMTDSVFADWDDEQIIIFIGAAVGPESTAPLPTDPMDPNFGQDLADFIDGADVFVNIAVGTFTVWVEDMGAATSNCPDHGADADPEPLACEIDWEIGALDGSADNPFNGGSCAVSGTCNDDYLGNGYDPNTGGQAQVTVTCIAIGGCEPKFVDVTAELIAGDPGGSDVVTGEVLCDNVPIATAQDNVIGDGPNLDEAEKAPDGDYSCVATFDVSTAPYSGKVTCSDPTVVPRNEPFRCDSVYDGTYVTAGGKEFYSFTTNRATCKFVNGSAALVCNNAIIGSGVVEQRCSVPKACAAHAVTVEANLLASTPAGGDFTTTLNDPCVTGGLVAFDNTANAMPVTANGMKVNNPSAPPLYDYVCLFTITHPAGGGNVKAEGNCHD
jgi:hypothetical protein